jgi:geranylgeranylglycerol-phosphate geranylgeranyltransferase
MALNKIRGIIRLIRPINCLMMGLAVLTGEFVAYRTLALYPSILGFTTAFTILGASMVTNDYWDRFVDGINAPSRPIVSGLVSLRLALSSAIILIVIGLSTALLTNFACFLMAIISLSVSLLYSYRGKKLGILGNFMVSSCTAIPLFYGGLVYVSGNLNFYSMRLLLLFDLIVFLANTGREVNKGIVDIEGDRSKGIKTVAVRFGSTVAAIVSVIFYLFAVALSIIPWFLSLTSLVYLPLVAIADCGFVISSFILLRDNSEEGAIKVKRITLVWMGIGLLAFVGGGI